MKSILGVLLILGGVVLGAYVGVWVCLVGGIVGLVSAVNMLIDKEGLDGMLVAFSILKIMFAGFFGYISVVVGFFSGAALLASDSPKKRNRKKKKTT
ncbi:hypothetical protein BEH_07910 [Priestia filamentosa]|uniref:Uncharacterized protein n=1 Tax=Priestia filamentosa TaxID=1402861 RepID=A0A0H4KGU8_9BACI|nr:hypothetical protein [Priestia filamentosa]AKO92031.1 hypothetical protein BEH_07910 [Priestia filamentosa]